AAFSKKQVIVTDIDMDPLWDSFRDLAQAHELKACWSTPVICSRGQVLGTFATYYPTIKTPSPEHLAAIERWVNLSRIMIEGNRTDQDLQQLNMELEERVTSRTLELEAANRELEAFAYSVSHDLRAPLRAISGFSEAVMEEYADKLEPEGVAYLRYVQEGSQEMSELIDGLLKLSRSIREPLTWYSVNLSKLANEIIQGLRRQTPTRQVDFIIAQDITVQGDARLLKIVLANLLSNAWKYSARVIRPKIEFGADMLPDTQQKVYYVKDNGAGFDMEYADKLFEPFQRLHHTHEFEGTGIGLATAQRIIQRHGGSIWAKASPNQGAIFFFTTGTQGLG
ncbi:MAG: ATP-binding protein, partial [Pseudomonadota bacterium]